MKIPACIAVEGQEVIGFGEIISVERYDEYQMEIVFSSGVTLLAPVDHELRIATSQTFGASLVGQLDMGFADV